MPPDQPSSRHSAMLAAYGFGLFPLPPYREISGPQWRLRHHLPGIAGGYLTGSAIETNLFVLYQGRKPWMSTGLMEQESHAFHVAAARGLVVVGGLGMGMYAFAAAAKPDVERIVVIEREATVVDILAAASGFESWADRTKIDLMVGDILSPDLQSNLVDRLDGRQPDYFYLDIWPNCPAATAPAETAELVRRIAPHAAGWWGQELSLGAWCIEADRAADEGAVRDYFRTVGVPVPATAGYVAFCRAVVEANRPGLTPRPARSWWKRVLLG